LAKVGKLAFGAAGMHLGEAFPAERFNGGEQGTGTEFFISIMLLADLTGVHGLGFHLVTDEKTGALVKTDHWVAWIIGQAIEPQDPFHLCEKVTIDLAQTPNPF
jgi:hypothetical protein